MSGPAPEAPGRAPARLAVALVRGLHGLRGTLRIEVLTDHPERRFAAGSTLFVEGERKPLTVASASPVADGPGWWLTLRQVGSRSAAEGLRDRYLEAEVAPDEGLEPGQAYWHEVVGAEVVGAAGRSLGRVAEVYRVGEAEVYVVRDGPAGEFDLPAVRGIVTEFEPAKGRIVVDEAALNLEDAGASPESAPAAVERRHPRWSRHGKGSAET